MILDRYQTGPDAPGAMPTAEWFHALMAGVDGPLGHVVDVGCAEGEMCRLAAEAGAETVLGIGLHDDRMAAALEVAAKSDRITIREQPASGYEDEVDTVIFSMMAHWLGRWETKRFAQLARRYFLVVFREANDHYSIPDNGQWFPTFEEMDATVGGIRTHENVVLAQDHDKRVIAATYRTDMEIVGKRVKKNDGWQPLYKGRDLHGDEPFRPTHGAGLAVLTESERESVLALAKHIAHVAHSLDFYPLDFSPRNVIVGEEGAFLVDWDEMAPLGSGWVPIDYVPVWRATLSTVGIDFDGDIGKLL